MPKKSEGGWSGIGMANSGIDPTHVYFLNDHPTQIPPSEILGPVVQNCRLVANQFFLALWPTNSCQYVPHLLFLAQQQLLAQHVSIRIPIWIFSLAATNSCP